MQQAQELCLKRISTLIELGEQTKCQPMNMLRASARSFVPSSEAPAQGGGATPPATAGEVAGVTSASHFFFYQARPGSGRTGASAGQSEGATRALQQGWQNAYLHPFNAKCMLHAAGGNFLRLPRSLQARVVDVESLSLDAKSRKRYLYLDHLPLASSVHLCEVDLFEPSSDSGPEVEPEPESEPGTKSDGEGVRATEAEPGVEPGLGALCPDRPGRLLRPETVAKFKAEHETRCRQRAKRREREREAQRKGAKQRIDFGGECSAAARERIIETQRNHAEVEALLASGELFQGPKPGESAGDSPASDGAGATAATATAAAEGATAAAAAAEEQRQGQGHSFARVASAQGFAPRINNAEAFPTLGGGGGGPTAPAPAASQRGPAPRQWGVSSGSSSFGRHPAPSAPTATSTRAVAYSSEDEEESAPPPPPAAWSFADVLEPAKDGGTDGAEVTGKKGGKGKGKRGKGKGKTLLFGNTGHRRM